jgi:hypothetical protein
MPLIDTFIAPTVQATIFRYEDRLTAMSLMFNYEVSSELESEIVDLSRQGFYVEKDKYTEYPAFSVSAPEENLMQIVHAMVKKHSLRVDLRIVKAGMQPTTISTESFMPEAN